MNEVGQPNALNRAVLLAFGLLVLGLLFRELVTLLVAVLVTVLVAIPLAATATRLERYQVPRPLGAFVGLLIGLGSFALALAIVIPSFATQVDEFVQQVPSIVNSLEETVRDAGGSDVGVNVQEFLQRYTEDPGALLGPIASIGLNVAGALAAIAVILITAFYMAIRPQPLVDGVLSLVPPDRRDWALSAMQRLRAAWVGWMEGVVVDMLITGVLLYVGLSLIGLDFAIVFAVFSAVLVLIPYFGAILGAFPPTLFALADSPEKALLALGIYVLVQQIESNLTIPLVMANRAKLHPAVVAIGVVVIGQLFGFAGLFVAVPILSMIVIAIDELWVKPLEARRGITTADPAEVGGELEAIEVVRPGSTKLPTG